MTSEVRVLLVDDSETIRKQFQMEFRKIPGFTLETAARGAEALRLLEEAVETNPFKIVICDWNMPEMEGIEVLDRVRAHHHPHIKKMAFIMLTSKDEKVVVAMDHGANNFIRKPLDLPLIRKKLEWVQ